MKPVPYVDKVSVEEHVGLLDELGRLPLGEQQVAPLVQQRRVQDLGSGVCKAGNDFIFPYVTGCKV